VLTTGNQFTSFRGLLLLIVLWEDVCADFSEHFDLRLVPECGTGPFIFFPIGEEKQHEVTMGHFLVNGADIDRRLLCGGWSCDTDS
jgi:hypothetical protein